MFKNETKFLVYVVATCVDRVVCRRDELFKFSVMQFLSEPFGTDFIRNKESLFEETFLLIRFALRPFVALKRGAV